MNEQLQALIDEAARQRDEVWALIDGVTDEEFSRRPAANKWSAAEHIAHLPITDRPYFGAIGTALEEARRHQWVSSGPFAGSAIGNWFARSMEPPVKRRMKTPRRLEPHAIQSREEIRADFVACREEFADLVRQWDGLDLDKARMTSPFLSLLKMSSYSGFQVLLSHARRHIWSAHQILGAAAPTPSPGP